MIKQRLYAILLAALMMAAFSSYTLAAYTDEDTDTRFVNARVVEVTDAHISIVARTGVEHVIAIDNKNTKVTMDGREVSLKDLREGDVVTIDLDAQKKIMFAKNIYMNSAQLEVARNRR